MELSPHFATFLYLPRELVQRITVLLDVSALKSMRQVCRSVNAPIDECETAWKRVYLELAKERGCMPLQPKTSWFEATFRFANLTFEERFGAVVREQLEVEAVPDRGLQIARELYTGFRVDTSSWHLHELFSNYIALSRTERGVKVLTLLLDLLFHEWCSRIKDVTLHSPKNLQKTRFQLLFDHKVESVETICTFLDDSFSIKNIAANALSNTLSENPELALVV